MGEHQVDQHVLDAPLRPKPAVAVDGPDGARRIHGHDGDFVLDDLMRPMPPDLNCHSWPVGCGMIPHPVCLISQQNALS